MAEETRSSWKFLFRLLYRTMVVIVWGLLLSCSRFRACPGNALRQATSMGPSEQEYGAELFEPLLDMEEELIDAYFGDYEQIALLAGPGELCPGGRVVLPEGITVEFGFDRSRRVRILQTEDARVRVCNGLGVGTMLYSLPAEVSERRNYGFGAPLIVEVCPGIFLAFESRDMRTEEEIAAQKPPRVSIDNEAFAIQLRRPGYNSP